MSRPLDITVTMCTFSPASTFKRCAGRVGTLHALGMAEANEAPLASATREVAEELGIGFGGGRLLVVDWVSPHGPWDDSLMFVFDGGTLTDQRQAEIRLSDGELAAFAFSDLDEASRLLRPYVWRRVQAALAALRDGGCAYLHTVDAA